MGHVEPEQDYYYDSEDFNDEDDYAPTSKKSKVSSWLQGDISTSYFSTPSFNPKPFNPGIFNHELSNPRLFNPRFFNHELFNSRLLNPGLSNPKYGIEKSQVGKF